MGIEAQPLLMDVHGAFSETEFGQTLSAQVRYDRYKPAEISNERWVELLGADVNNLTHLPLTFGLTRVMVTELRQTQPGFLSTDEENLLGAAAIIHDWAEAVVGDISYSDKTVDDEEAEKEQLALILANFDGAKADDAFELIERAAQEIVFSPESKLGHAFNTVERAGYLRTALRAAGHVIQGTAADCDTGLRWIVADVFGNHLEALFDRATTFVPIHSYLTNKRFEINDAFTIVDRNIFMNYDVSQRLAKEEAFYNASQALHEWCMRNTYSSEYFAKLRQSTGLHY